MVSVACSVYYFLFKFFICSWIILFLFQTETVPIRTVNRQCSSGLQAVTDVAAAIKAGLYEIGKSNFNLLLSLFPFVEL